MGNERVWKSNLLSGGSSVRWSREVGSRKGKKGLEKEGKGGKLKEVSSCFSQMGWVIEYSVRITSAH